MDGSPVNTTRAVTVSSVFYALRLLLPPGTPTNGGVLLPVRIVTPQASVVDAAYPAAVRAGNVETSQCLVDVLLGALSLVAPDQIPAASAGTMNNLSFGGVSPTGKPFTHYETHGGGAGGGPQRAGAHAVQTHMTNTRNTPIESLETEMPVRVIAQSVRRKEWGGRGAPWGRCIVRRLRFLTDVRLAWMGGRQRRAPYGLQGGQRGRLGEAFLQRPGAESTTVDPKAAIDIEAGSEFELRSPGGGGHGVPPPL